MAPEGSSHQELVRLEQVADIARRLAAEDDLDGLLQRLVDLGEEYLAGATGPAGQGA